MKSNNSDQLTGLVVGKFAPLHPGHEYLLDRARSLCQKLIIISYSLPEFPDCCAQTRQGWLKKLYPDTETLVVEAADIEVWKKLSDWSLSFPHNSDPDDTHRLFCAHLLDKRLHSQVDLVFSSESYGEGFAEFLDNYQQHRYGNNARRVKHIPVDPQRKQFPYHGTEIRKRKPHDTALLNPVVQRDYRIRSVCFIGAESTGKSTLITLLAKHFSTEYVPEYGRELWQTKNGNLTREDLFHIVDIQIERENHLRKTANSLLFCDTSPLTTLLYYEAMFASQPSKLLAHASRPYQHLFLCVPDFPLIQDGTRRDEEFRQWQHQRYLIELKRKRISYIVLGGSLQEKKDQVIEILS